MFNVCVGVCVFSQVVVVQAISALCQKYPRKHGVMMNFLSNMLRDDVSYAEDYGPSVLSLLSIRSACRSLCSGFRR